MGRLFNGTSSDYLQSSSTVDLSGTNMVTLAFWLYWDSFANNDHLAFDTYNGSVTGFMSFNPNASSTGKCNIDVCGVSAPNFVEKSFTRPSGAAWHHYVFPLDPSTSGAGAIPAVYVDGVSQSLTTVSTGSTTGNFANNTLNFMNRQAASLFAAGRLAEFAIWSGVLLSADDATALSLGYRPLKVRPGKLGWYWPLLTKQSPEIELIKANGATVTGTSLTDHPRVIY